MLLCQCVINFKSTELERNLIRNYLIDTLKRAISGNAKQQTPRIQNTNE